MTPNNDVLMPIDSSIIESLIADDKVRRAVTKKSHLMFFSVYFSEYLTYPMAPFHWDMFKLTESHDRMVVLMAFRGSGKSTIFTLSFPIWAILGDLKKKFIVILAQTQQQAKLYITNIKRELEGNALLRSDLGPFREGEDEWSSGTLVFPDHGARISVLSLEQSIRGQRHGAHRPDLIICDDLEDLASVKTHESRTKTYQWLMGDVIPAGDINTKIVVIGNMLHEESLIMRLKQEIEAEQREGVFREYPIINTKGECAWAGKFPTPESLETLKSMIGNDAAWQREYLLNIISDAERVVHPDWIQYYDGDALTAEHEGYNITGVGIDLAISLKDTADFTAMVTARVVTVNRRRFMYILPNPVNEHLAFPQTIERIKLIRTSFGSKERLHLLIENVGYQEAVIQQLSQERITVEGVNPHGQDKRARLALTTNYIQSGAILFPKVGAEELIRQLVGFGKERHDDLADAFSIVVLKLSAYMYKPSPQIYFLEARPYYDDGPPFTRGLRTMKF